MFLARKLLRKEKKKYIFGKKCVQKYLYNVYVDCRQKLFVLTIFITSLKLIPIAISKGCDVEMIVGYLVTFDVVYLTGS